MKLSDAHLLCSLVGHFLVFSTNPVLEIYQEVCLVACCLQLDMDPRSN